MPFYLLKALLPWSIANQVQKCLFDGSKETLNARVAWYSMLSLFCLIALSGAQIFYIQRYLKVPYLLDHETDNINLWAPTNVMSLFSEHRKPSGLIKQILNIFLVQNKPWALLPFINSIVACTCFWRLPSSSNLPKTLICSRNFHHVLTTINSKENGKDVVCMSKEHYDYDGLHSLFQS